MAADMICAYYDREADNRNLFEKRLISKCEPIAIESDSGESKMIRWDDYLGSFDVLRIVMTDFMEDVHSVKEMLQYLTEEVTEELMEEYSDARFGKRITLRNVMN